MNDFLDFCRQRGVIIQSLPPLGVWRRYPTEDHPKKRNGAVKWLGEFGHCQNHATMTDVDTWRAEEGAAPYVQSPAMAAQIEASKARERQKRIDGMRGARELWSRSQRLLGGHPYLTRKGLSMQGCTGLRVGDWPIWNAETRQHEYVADTLLIPMHHGEFLTSVQGIDGEGNKHFFTGGSTKGSYYSLLRQRASVTAFAEGFATALSIYQSLPMANVICCFTAGNLIEVAKVLKPTGSVVWCADNDHGTFANRGFNPGLDAARNAAALVGGGVACPEDVFGSLTDWADVMKERGHGGQKFLCREILKHAQYVA